MKSIVAFCILAILAVYVVAVMGEDYAADDLELAENRHGGYGRGGYGGGYGRGGYGGGYGRRGGYGGYGGYGK